MSGPQIKSATPAATRKKAGGRGTGWSRFRKSNVVNDDKVVVVKGVDSQHSPSSHSDEVASTTTGTTLASSSTPGQDKRKVTEEPKRKRIARVFGRSKKEQQKPEEVWKVETPKATVVSFGEPTQIPVTTEQDVKSRDTRSKAEKVKCYRNQAILLLQSISIESRLKQSKTMFKSNEQLEERWDIDRRARKAYEYAAEARRLHESENRSERKEGSRLKHLSLPKVFGKWRSHLTMSSTAEEDDNDSVASMDTTFSSRLEQKYRQQKEKETKLLTSTETKHLLNSLDSDKGETASFFLSEARRIVDSLVVRSAMKKEIPHETEAKSTALPEPEISPKESQDGEALCCSLWQPWETEDEEIAKTETFSSEATEAAANGKGSLKMEKQKSAASNDVGVHRGSASQTQKEEPSATDEGGTMWLTFFQSFGDIDPIEDEEKGQTRSPTSGNANKVAEDSSVDEIEQNRSIDFEEYSSDSEGSSDSRSSSDSSFSLGDTTYGDTSIGASTAGPGVAGWIRSL